MSWVTFTTDVKIYTGPSTAEEDRSSPWISMAVDTIRFQTCIKMTEQIISPILVAHLERMKSLHQSNNKAGKKVESCWNRIKQIWSFSLLQLLLFFVSIHIGDTKMYLFYSPTTIKWMYTIRKNYLDKRLLGNLEHLFPNEPPKSALYCYVVFQPVFTEMQSMGIKVEFHEGVPSEDTIDSFREDGHHCIIISDNLMQSIYDNETIESISHHKNITLLFVNQNLLCQGRSSTSIAKENDP